MPVGEECQLPPPPVSVEPGLTTAHGGGGVEVEGGMENLGEDRKLRATGRRKRKVAASISGYSVQETVQVNNEGDPINQQQLMIPLEEHNSATKRQCLEGYASEAASSDQQQGHEETSEEATPQDMYPPTSAADTEPSRIGEEGEEGEEREVDIGVVFRSEVAKAHDFMAKCEEALSEGVAYEAFFPVRIDEMLRAAHTLEQSLLDQKLAMKERLQEIIGIL